MTNHGFTFSVTPYNFAIGRGSSLELCHRRRPVLSEEWDDSTGTTEQTFIHVWDDNEQDLVLLTFRVPHYHVGAGLTPNVFYLHETETMFVACGQTVVTYALQSPKQMGCFRISIGENGRWFRCGNVVCCDASYDFIAFSADGRNLWNTTYEMGDEISICGDKLQLIHDGQTVVFDPHVPPPWVP